MKEFDGNGSKCVHRMLLHKYDEDEAMPRKVVYVCSNGNCNKEFTIEIEDETYWDVQNLV